MMSVEKVQAALNELGIKSEFEDVELKNLAASGFDSAEALLAATKEDLTSCKLRHGRIAIILSRKQG